MDILQNFIDDFKIGTEEFLSYILETDDDDLLQFINLLNDIINKPDNLDTPDTGFNFIANSTLSGLSFPCAELTCKLANVLNLARNAILYADTVYIQNPFEAYIKYDYFNEKIRYDIVNDLIVLNEIRPLLKQGIFKFAKTTSHFCYNCYIDFQEKYLKTFDYNLDLVNPLIEDYILKHVNFYLINSKNKGVCIEISGDNDLLQHPIVISFIEKVPDVIKNINLSSDRVKLESTLVKEIGLTYYILHKVEENLSYQDYYSKYYSAHVLTSSDFDINLIQVLNKTPIQKNKADILKNLGHMVPFLEDVPLKKLIKLRKSEGEAFQVYRDKLSKIVKSDKLSISESKELFLDEIRPEINKINLTLKNNKKVLWGNIKSNVFLASTYISTSLFAGILPSNIDKIVASVGGFGFAKSIGQDTLNLIKKPEIRTKEFYFLWKIINDNKIKI